MNLNAIQHQAYNNFCYAVDENQLEISVLTGKDIEKVFLHWADPFRGGIFGGTFKWKADSLEMTEKKSLQTHFRWTVRITPPAKRARYYFTLVSGSETMYFLETGFYTEEEFDKFKNFTGCFTFPWMNPADIMKTPEWAASAVFYQIFPSRFCRGKSDFIPENMQEWGKFGEKAVSNEVFGGNLQGVSDKLTYLENLGITGIYMTPINQAKSQHKYDTEDYLTVDKSFGTNKDLKNLVENAHKHGIRIILDAVFNHCGWTFPQWQDVIEKREKSQYASWFMINDFNFKIDQKDWFKMDNAINMRYYSFAFTDFMPKLNTNNPEVRQYLIDVATKWVEYYDIDGLRMDVANEISHKFIQELKTKMTSLKKDFYIVGEIWHNSEPWLQGNEFDSVMNYPLQNEILAFCKNKAQTAEKFEWGINRCFSMYCEQANKVLFNQMDSHDTMRMITRFENNKSLAQTALALLFSMPGTPCIYYGTEIFLEGGDDPDNRRCMPWTEIDAGCFEDDIAFMKTLIDLRKIHPALRGTKITFEKWTTDSGENTRLLRIAKKDERTGEEMTLFVNCSEQTALLPSDTVVLFSNGCKNGVLEPDCFALAEG